MKTYLIVHDFVNVKYFEVCQKIKGVMILLSHWLAYYLHSLAYTYPWLGIQIALGFKSRKRHIDVSGFTYG